jgi:hypothetical protein
MIVEGMPSEYDRLLFPFVDVDLQRQDALVS